MRPEGFSLCYITDRKKLLPGELPLRIREAVEAEVPLVQIREKDMDTRELLALVGRAVNLGSWPGYENRGKRPAGRGPGRRSAGCSPGRRVGSPGPSPRPSAKVGADGSLVPFAGGSTACGGGRRRLHPVSPDLYPFFKSDIPPTVGAGGAAEDLQRNQHPNPGPGGNFSRAHPCLPGGRGSRSGGDFSVSGVSFFEGVRG